MERTHPARADDVPASDPMLEALLAHGTGPVLLGRPDGTLLRANAAACAALGRTEEELRAIGRAGIVQPSSSLDSLLAERARNATAWGEVLFRRPDGTTFPVELSSTLIPLTGVVPVVIVSFRDVSAQRAAARALLESEERARVALDAAQLGTWRQDLRTADVTFDARGAEHFDLPSGTVAFPDVLARIHPDDLARVDAAIRQVTDPASSTGRYDLEYRVVWRDGTVRWTAVHASVWFEGEGPSRRAVSAIGTTQDVTERRRREEALRASEEQLRLAQDAARMGSWAWSPVTGEHVCSARANELLGLAPDATVTYERFLAAIHVDDRARVEHAIRVALEQRTDLDVEMRVTWPDGTVRWISSMGRASYDEDGRPVRLSGMARDITERVRAEEELRHLAAAVEQTPASIVVTDEAGVIQFVNPAFERVSGYSREEAIGQRASLLRSGAHDDAFYRSLWETIGAGEVWKGRFVNRSRSGRLFTEDAVVAPVRDAEDRIRNYVAVKRDVTDEIALQEALAQAQKLESVGRLAGGVAHDFNNVLTVILSCAEELKIELADAAALVRDDIDEIRMAGERARDLTAQLLAFARQQVIAPVPLDLDDTVRGCERLLRRVIGEDVELVVIAERGRWTARCDPGQLDQAIMNLAVNARDAMPRGGRLVLETSNFIAALADGPLYGGIAPGEYVRLAVRDTGCGMTPEVKSRMFEPFFTTKAAGKGTGLGLATVYGIVKQSDGYVRVDSEPGCGTSIEICFPRTHDEAEGVRSAGAAAERGGTETVLLVEDDAAVRDVAARALRSAGYSVAVAATAADALALAARTRIDLLVTDVVMPGLDGSQLAERLSAARPDLRVLYVSGYAESSIIHHGEVEVGVHFLSKPFTRSTLLARVRVVLDAAA